MDDKPNTLTQAVLILSFALAAATALTLVYGLLVAIATNIPTTILYIIGFVIALQINRVVERY